MTARRDDRRPDVAEHEEQHRDDQQGAEGEVVLDGPDRRVDQLGAVQHRVGDDARRQAAIDLLEPLADARGDGAAVLARRASGRCRRRPRARSRWRSPAAARGPSPTVATSDTRMTRPPRRPTGVCASSSMLRTRASARTT